MIGHQVGKSLKSYEIEELVGTGGFGAVYRARQAVVEREVAIKIIWPAFANHPNFIRRFEAEAQLIAGLEHPHIVPLYDYWRDPDGAYIIMPYLEGGHLHAALEKRTFALPEATRLLTQVSGALALAHRYGIVHRDIKPENILFDETGKACLTDFGITQMMNTSGSSSFSSPGSPAYAAPEQIAGLVPTIQSDLYSIGVILYEVLTGEQPFPDVENCPPADILDIRAHSLLPPLHLKRPDLPRALNEVLQRATALDPNGRYADAPALLRAFQQASGAAGRMITGVRFAPAGDNVPNPYKGLRPFEEKDAGNFYGREALVQRLVMRMAEQGSFSRFLAIVGPSGSGKSSLVKAGLIPRLRAGALPGSADWYYDQIVPGDSPFDELANLLLGLAITPPADLRERLTASEQGLLQLIPEVLPDDGSELLLFIDQFEELFTLAPDESSTNRFLDMLHAALTAPDSRLRVVITIRADFYDRPLLQPRLSGMVRERTEVVVPLSPAELERAIVEPARRTGIMVDSGLVAAIINEIKEHPGALPLLQYTLTELFERREGALVTSESYRAIGGVRGALARRADDIYKGFTDRERSAARQLLLRLITLGEGTEDTRRRVLLTEVNALQGETTASEDLRSVIEQFGAARLLTFDRDPISRSPTVEITHEALIREWSLLRTWLDENRVDVRMQRTFSGLAQEWIDNRRESSYLLRGARLQSAEKWAESTALALTANERHYLEASLQERALVLQDEQQRTARERQLERQSLSRLRLLVAALLVTAVGAFVLSGFALSESSRATSAQAASDANAAISQSIAWEASARRALADADQDLALLLALQANQMTDPPVQAVTTLAEVAFAEASRAVITAHSGAVTAIDISRDGRWTASGSTDAVVKIWDTASGTLLHTLRGHRADIQALVFSPDGNWLVSAGSDRVAILWDTASGAEVRRFSGHTQVIRSAAWSADGRYLLTGSSDTTMILWNAASGQIVRRFEGHSASVLTVGFTLDGRFALSASRDGRLIQWDIATGIMIRELSGHRTAASALAFHPLRNRLVTSANDGSLMLWDLETGSLIREFPASDQAIRDLVISPDGQRLYLAAADGNIQIRAAESGLPVGQLRGHSDDVLGLAVSADGQALVSASRDHTMRFWNSGIPAAEQIVRHHTARVTGVVASQDSSQFYSVAVDGSLLVESRSPSAAPRSLSLDTALLALALSPDGTQAVAGTRSGDIYLLDLATLETRAVWSGHQGAVTDLLYLADGRHVLSAGRDGLVLLWDVANGQVVRRFEGHASAVYSITLHPDQQRFVSVSSDYSMILWDIASGEPLRQSSTPDDALYSVQFSPDGSRIAAGSQNGNIVILDAATGEEQQRLLADAGTVWSLSFDAQGSRLAAGYADGSVLIWSPESAEPLAHYQSGTATVFDVSFTPDGRNLIAGQENGTVIVWRAYSPEELLRWIGENRYIRGWECSEIERYRIPDSSSCAG